MEDKNILLKSGSKIKFNYDKWFIKGRISGKLFHSINANEKTESLHGQILFSKESCEECKFVGLYHGIDLNKEIKLCDDGYYLVHLFHDKNSNE